MLEYILLVKYVFNHCLLIFLYFKVLNWYFFLSNKIYQINLIKMLKNSFSKYYIIYDLELVLLTEIRAKSFQLVRKKSTAIKNGIITNGRVKLSICDVKASSIAPMNAGTAVISRFFHPKLISLN